MFVRSVRDGVRSTKLLLSRCALSSSPRLTLMMDLADDERGERRRAAGILSSFHQVVPSSHPAPPPVVTRDRPRRLLQQSLRLRLPLPGAHFLTVHDPKRHHLLLDQSRELRIRSHLLLLLPRRHLLQIQLLLFHLLILKVLDLLLQARDRRSLRQAPRAMVGKQPGRSARRASDRTALPVQAGVFVRRERTSRDLLAAATRSRATRNAVFLIASEVVGFGGVVVEDGTAAPQRA